MQKEAKNSKYQKINTPLACKSVSGIFCQILIKIGDIEISAPKNGGVVSPLIPVVKKSGFWPILGVFPLETTQNL